jgi:GNAT superfamily N-acetyltransferase
LSDEIEIDGAAIAVHPPNRANMAALARFAAIVPPHDLLFLARDIREHRVLEAWIAAVEASEVESLIALTGGEVVATTANVSDKLSWSRHVCEIRLLVAPAYRNKGLGRRLLERAIARAVAGGATKLTARMTPDQTGAITLFEECGFKAEALLRDEVSDADGNRHDLAILALDPTREAAKLEAFGAS